MVLCYDHVTSIMGISKPDHGIKPLYQRLLLDYTWPSYDIIFQSNDKKTNSWFHQQQEYVQAKSMKKNHKLCNRWNWKTREVKTEHDSCKILPVNFHKCDCDSPKIQPIRKLFSKFSWNGAKNSIRISYKKTIRLSSLANMTTKGRFYRCYDLICTVCLTWQKHTSRSRVHIFAQSLRNQHAQFCSNTDVILHWHRHEITILIIMLKSVDCSLGWLAG